MFRSIRRAIYLLQLENYNLKRYFSVAAKRFFSKDKMREAIVWTPKLATLSVLAFFLLIAIAYLATRPLIEDEMYLGLFPLAFLFLFLLLCYFYFVFLILAAWVVSPFDYLIKNIIISQARAKLTKFGNLKIIGITGSFGKTTTKEVLGVILNEKFRVLKTPESVNTPVGISRLILKDLSTDTQILIVEMGAYHRGDIKALCSIARPDIAVLTGINEAHLQRFGSMENTITTKFELVENAKGDALILLNEENKLVVENFQKFIGFHKPVFYSRTVSGQYRDIKLAIPGDYIWGVVSACVIIAKELGMTDAEIRLGIQKIKAIPHRLQVIENRVSGITVIDDSYNGNPEGVREAIKVLGAYKDRRKIYITPGLVEMGDKVREVHNNIGDELRSTADLIILIKNSVTPFIAEKLDQHKIVWFDSAPMAHLTLPEILKSGDVVMFQNDWPDNYI